MYHATLKENPDALAYLKARGLGHPEMIERFKLGYANRTLGYRLPDGRIKAGAELRSQLAEIGVYRETGHEHLAGSLVTSSVHHPQRVFAVQTGDDAHDIRLPLRGSTP